MKNAGIVADGDFLYKRLVDTGLAQELENIIKGLNDGAWGIRDVVETYVNEKGGKISKVSIITPHHNQRGPVNTSMYYYAIDRETYELIIQTSKGWTRTGYIVRFVTHH